MIETDRLIIRKFVPSDWKDLYDYLSLKEIYIFEPGQPITKEEAKKMAANRSCGNDFFAVTLKKINKMVGHLYFSHIQPLEFMTWELGFIFNPSYQSKGYCSEASKSLIEHAFIHWNVHRITAYCNPNNFASWKVLEKIGMKREGFFEKQGFFRRDENNRPIWHDCYAYGKLRG
ncbi:MAG: GNAT family N-acetyltransferase [Thermotogota bacterium]